MDAEQGLKWVVGLAVGGWALWREWRKREESRRHTRQSIGAEPQEEKLSSAHGEWVEEQIDRQEEEGVATTVQSVAVEHADGEEGEVWDVATGESVEVKLDLRTMVIGSELLKPKWREDD